MTAEHFDVLIIGAGLSGVGAAHVTLLQCSPTYVVVQLCLECKSGCDRRATALRSDSAAWW